MPAKFSNNAVGTLASSVTNSATTITLAAGQGVLFPTLAAGDYFYATVGAPGASEIVKVTTRVGETLTVARAQEGTTAIAHSAGIAIRLLITAAALNIMAQTDSNNTFSGVNTFSGNNTLSGANTFSGANNFTSNNQIASLGVGTAASGTAGEIRATNNITAYYSDDRLKTKLGNIENALDKIRTLNGFYYEANETAQALGYEAVREVGVSAQQVQAVQPEIVVPAPIDDKYLTVRYERLVPLLIEAIKELDGKMAKRVVEQDAKIAKLEALVAKLIEG
jgi:hypothetical protein